MTTLHKIVDGVVVPLSQEEVLQVQAETTQWEAEADERAALAMRTIRDRLIKETDWWVLPDRTATQEQLDYRQALRDITSQAGFPHDITWPTKPE